MEVQELVPSPWSSSSSFLVLVLATLLFVAAFLRRRQGARRKYNIPPGPRPWPVIGNLNLIGALPYRSIRDLSRRYGPLMSLRFGSFPVVVGSSVDMARYFLRANDLAFLDRPRTAAGRYTVYNYAGVLWSHYGEYWRQARRLWVTELLSARRLASTEHVRAEEVRAMLRGLSRRAGAGTAVVLKEHMLMVTLNVISRMVFGKKYIVEEGEGSSPTTAEEFRWMIEEIFFLNGVFNIGDMVPWLGWLDPQGYIGRMKRLGGMFDRFLEHILDEHVERRRREGDGFAARDMVDLLLQFADDPSLKVPIQRDGVKAFILELITGSTDTTSVSVEWAMSEVLRNPSVLARATDELDRVVGRRRLVAEGDIPNLPYLDAVVKESMRLHPVVPLLVPRVSREDAFSVSVAGAAASYDIPAGTRVLVNVWAIGRDPAVWGDDAEEFRPERFAAGGERGGVDVKGQDFELLPFGSGRRMCPGFGLGLKMVQLTLANLLHGFAWRLPGGAAAEELSMEEKFGISVSRLVQLKAIPEPKLPAHLYDE
ncbi:trimethyltridecatetraene synthase [Oryza sativa Japonica Group]|uniref:Cytochrome P450 monooxygenase n=1 Tax=Oryza sativa subsp. japonica TaxID=39947 RepID=Q6K6C8_ORYSJ|nr:cytochrome P450 71A1 [Oryza sativa Japonica Group]BAD22905.1 putative cytochrome P450 monooxygenase [Oryza sativa Japonica Group]BAD23209.1 putative cytochrome P450 monooxygenase [Oryza sativa Japonica Group]